MSRKYATQLTISVPEDAYPGAILSIPLKGSSEPVKVRVPENCGPGRTLVVTRQDGSDEWTQAVLEDGQDEEPQPELDQEQQQQQQQQPQQQQQEHQERQQNQHQQQHELQYQQHPQHQQQHQQQQPQIPQHHQNQQQQIHPDPQPRQQPQAHYESQHNEHPGHKISIAPNEFSHHHHHQQQHYSTTTSTAIGTNTSTEGGTTYTWHQQGSTSIGHHAGTDFPLPAETSQMHDDPEGLRKYEAHGYIHGQEQQQQQQQQQEQQHRGQHAQDDSGPPRTDMEAIETHCEMAGTHFHMVGDSVRERRSMGDLASNHRPHASTSSHNMFDRGPDLEHNKKDSHNHIYAHAGNNPESNINPDTHNNNSNTNNNSNLQNESFLSNLSDSAAAMPTPVAYTVRLETSAGIIDIIVRPDWAPHGAQRFLELATAGDFDNITFYRAVRGCLAQFGLPAKRNWPAIPDDPQTGVPFLLGAVCFAAMSPNSRRSTLFICLGDMRQCLGQHEWETPIGAVAEASLDALDLIETGYGDIAECQGNGPEARRLSNEGDDYLRRDFPKLTRIYRATPLDWPPQSPAPTPGPPESKVFPREGRQATQAAQVAEAARSVSALFQGPPATEPAGDARLGDPPQMSCTSTGPSTIVDVPVEVSTKRTESQSSTAPSVVASVQDDPKVIRYPSFSLGNSTPTGHPASAPPTSAVQGWPTAPGHGLYGTPSFDPLLSSASVQPAPHQTRYGQAPCPLTPQHQHWQQSHGQQAQSSCPSPHPRQLFVPPPQSAQQSLPGLAPPSLHTAAPSFPTTSPQFYPHHHHQHQPHPAQHQHPYHQQLQLFPHQQPPPPHPGVPPLPSASSFGSLSMPQLPSGGSAPPPHSPWMPPGPFQPLHPHSHPYSHPQHLHQPPLPHHQQPPSWHGPCGLSRSPSMGGLAPPTPLSVPGLLPPPSPW